MQTDRGAIKSSAEHSTKGSQDLLRTDGVVTLVVKATHTVMHGVT